MINQHSPLRSARQLRAARAMAGLTRDELAKAVPMHHKSIAYWEDLSADRDLRRIWHKHSKAIVAALETRGVTLTADPVGVALTPGG